MKAMVLAAGLGTRLRPLTDNRPKALVQVGNRTLLQITLQRLQSAGIFDAIVNVHHFPEMIIDYLRANNNFGMHIEISREDILLDTGGGLKRASPFFLKDPALLDEPFILHNVDVLSTIDLSLMVRRHRESGALATLAVQDRTTSRYLLFDEAGALCGRRLVKEELTEIARPAVETEALAFSGVHVISPRLLNALKEEGGFSIITAYLRLASEGERILAFRADGDYWRDMGKPEQLAQAEEDLKRGLVEL